MNIDALDYFRVRGAIGAEVGCSMPEAPPLVLPRKWAGLSTQNRFESHIRSPSCE
jgi:hypothetical protein